MSDKYREVTWAERQAMMEGGVFDVNGNLPCHPAYTGIHAKGEMRPREEVMADCKRLEEVARRYEAQMDKKQIAEGIRRIVGELNERLVDAERAGLSALFTDAAMYARIKPQQRIEVKLTEEIEY